MKKLIGLAALLLVVAAGANQFGAIGGGHFGQFVLVKAAKPVGRVTYCTLEVDENTRKIAEETADPQLFPWTEAERSGDGFMARVKTTSSGGAFGMTKIHHPPHLVVYIEFVDKSRTCRVAKIPPGHGKQAIVLNIE